MKYFVIATHWDDNRKAQVKYIAGQFDNYMNASLHHAGGNGVTLSKPAPFCKCGRVFSFFNFKIGGF